MLDPSACATLQRQGYSYRLCKADQELTEECFQKTPLQFNRSQSALVWNNGTRYNLGDKAVFVDEGTFPKGSTWARNPIPRVADDTTGTADPAGCPGPNGRSGPRCIQFPALCPQDNGREPWSTDGSGQGACSGDWTVGFPCPWCPQQAERPQLSRNGMPPARSAGGAGGAHRCPGPAWRGGQNLRPLASAPDLRHPWFPAS